MFLSRSHLMSGELNIEIDFIFIHFYNYTNNNTINYKRQIK